jgi:hypothetical protein
MIPSYIQLKTDSANSSFWQSRIEICQTALGKIDFGKNRTKRHKLDIHSANGYPVHKEDVSFTKWTSRSQRGHPVH